MPQEKIIRSKLSKEEKKIYDDFKKYYKEIYRCNLCKKLFGSDIINARNCSVCESNANYFRRYGKHRKEKKEERDFNIFEL